MSRLLVTGGTVFVSRFIAEYFRDKGHDICVLNRNTREQPDGVRLIKADRHCIGDALKDTDFDAVIDVTAYGPDDISGLLNALGSFGKYVMISSSAVYPETAAQPFREDAETGPNRYWGKYGTDKIIAEQMLLQAVPDAYILRPPYLYGPGNNVYREGFVFDCAMQKRPFYLPGDGSMKLQFFHVRDLCKIIEAILAGRSCSHIMNVGNPETISVREWTDLCYGCAGQIPEYRCVSTDIEQRNYFSFYNYEYMLDVTEQAKVLPETIPMEYGLQESFTWYTEHRGEVRIKPFMEYIDRNLSEIDGTGKEVH